VFHSASETRDFSEAIAPSAMVGVLKVAYGGARSLRARPTSRFSFR